MSTLPNEPHKSFAALRHPQYRYYFFTTALAMMADNIEHVISYWVLFQKFHSPTLAGVAVVTHWLPFLLLSVYAGALADRYDNRRIIQLAMLLYMIASIGWALLFLTNTTEQWHAIVLLTIHGIAGVLWMPASQMLIHDIVGDKNLQSAIRLNATGRQLGILIGPAVGGGLMLAFGPAVGLIVNVIIYVPLIYWLAKTSYGQRLPQKAANIRPKGGLNETLSTIRLAAQNPLLISMVFLAGMSSFFIGNAFQAQMPEFAHDLGAGTAAFSYSLLLASNAGGAFFGGMLLEAKSLLQSSARSAIICTILWCVCMGGFALTQSFNLALVLMFLGGFFNLTFNSMSQTLVQIHAPLQIRGRMIGLYNMSNNGLRTFSGLTVGMLGAMIGIHASLAMSAFALMAIAVAMLIYSVKTKKI